MWHGYTFLPLIKYNYGLMANVTNNGAYPLNVILPDMYLIFRF